jgi:hypothetical protein
VVLPASVENALDESKVHSWFFEGECRNYANL